MSLTGLAVANEFAAFMQNARKRYNVGMVEVLSALWSVAGGRPWRLHRQQVGHA